MTEKVVKLHGDATDDSRLVVTLTVAELRALIRAEMANTTKDDALMDVEEVAQFLKQSVDWVYRHWKQLGGRKIGAKSIRFYRRDIDGWLKTRNI